MNTIASKNLYDLLGNDPEQDPDRAPEPPTQAVEKPVARTGKRNDTGERPVRDSQEPSRGGRGGRREGPGGNEGAFRDRNAGSYNNRTKPTEEGARPDRAPREGGRGRGDRRGGRGFGGRGPRAERGDRQSHSNIGEHEKQAAHGWGGETGAAELADENAGEAIAQAEATEEPGLTPDTGAADPAFSNGPSGPTAGEDVAPAEEEEKTKTYEEYQAELKEKRAALGAPALEVRKANEGSKQKFPEGKAFSRAEEQEDFMAGREKKQREKKTREGPEKVNLEANYYAAPDMGGGGRGGGRGGRGEGRGGRSRGDREGGFRGEGRGRGGRGRGEGRGEFRGPRGGDRPSRGGANFNAADESAFPSLGA